MKNQWFLEFSGFKSEPKSMESWVKNHTWGGLATQDASKTPQDAPKTLQDASKTPQDAPKTLPRHPKTPPRRAQDVPTCPQDAPRRSQDEFWEPKLHQNGAKLAPESILSRHLYWKPRKPKKHWKTNEKSMNYKQTNKQINKQMHK